jgi:hypothetical protein
MIRGCDAIMTHETLLFMNYDSPFRVASYSHGHGYLKRMSWICNMGPGSSFT